MVMLLLIAQSHIFKCSKCFLSLASLLCDVSHSSKVLGCALELTRTYEHMCGQTVHFLKCLELVSSQGHLGKLGQELYTFKRSSARCEEVKRMFKTLLRSC